MVNSAPPVESLVRRLRFAQLQMLRLAGSGVNFRDIALALHVTQPAITKMAQELERALGAPVFARGGGGVRLTPFGQAVRVHAQRALVAIEQLAEDLPRFRDGAMPALRIGAPYFTAAMLLARPVALAMRRDPGTRVLLSDGVGAQLLAALRVGELDCVIGSVDEGSASDADLAQLHFEPLYDDHVSFVTHLDTPHHARLRRLEQLRELPWVLPPRASQVWMALRREYASAGHPPPAGVVESSSIPAIGAILRHAPGVIGAARSDAGHHLVRQLGLRELTIRPRVRMPTMGVLRLRAAPPARALEDLLADVRQEVARMRRSP